MDELAGLQERIIIVRERRFGHVVDFELNWGILDNRDDSDEELIDDETYTSVPFPPRLWTYTEHLEILTIRDCMHSRLPHLIGQLKGLRELILVECYFTEPLPASIGCLKRLQVLHIILCPSVVALPPEIGQLDYLRVLKLQVNHMLQSIPTEVGNLRNLEKFISLQNRNVVVPASVFQIQTLQQLMVVDFQRISLPVTGFSLLRNLNCLQIQSRNEQIPNPTVIDSSSLPRNMGGLSNLNTLILGTLMLGALPASIGFSTNLERLEINRLYWPQLPNDVMFQTYRQLQHWPNAGPRLSYCSNFVYPLHGIIGQLVNLKRLSISDHWLGPFSPEEAQSLGLIVKERLPRLENLYVSGSNSLLRAVPFLPQLLKLEIGPMDQLYDGSSFQEVFRDSITELFCVDNSISWREQSRLKSLQISLSKVLGFGGEFARSILQSLPRTLCTLVFQDCRDIISLLDALFMEVSTRNLLPPGIRTLRIELHIDGDETFWAEPRYSDRHQLRCAVNSLLGTYVELSCVEIIDSDGNNVIRPTFYGIFLQTLNICGHVLVNGCRPRNLPLSLWPIILARVNEKSLERYDQTDNSKKLEASVLFHLLKVGGPSALLRPPSDVGPNAAIPRERRGSKRKPDNR